MKSYDWSNKNLRVVEWVKCSERMPEEEKRYFVSYVTLKGGSRQKHFVADYDPIEERWLNLLGDVEIVWWMEIPELPEGGE
jgi:hypothetical protein